MKRCLAKLATATILMVLADCLACAAERNDVSAAFRSFIERNLFADQLRPRVGHLIAKGYSPQITSAFNTEFKGVDEAGQVIGQKSFILPFIGPSGDMEASIIGRIVEYASGGRLDEFISTIIITPVKSADAVDDSDKRSLGGDTSTAIDIAEAFRVIAHEGRLAGVAFVSQKINAGISDVSLSNAIRAGFESRGYSCPIPPIGFVPASIWYAASCVRPGK